MKKFIFHFAIIFLVVFSILNSRFVAAQIKFAFFHDRDQGPVIVNDAKTQPPAIKLPIAKPSYYILEIPAIGIKAPVILEKNLDQNVIFKRLEDGVVHYAGSPLPGSRGTAVILGHSSAYPWYRGNYGSVFALLGKLEIGDTVYVKNGSETLTYKVSDSLVFHPLSNDKQISQLENTDGSAIVLVSCWPVGTDYKRIAIKAELI